MKLIAGIAMGILGFIAWAQNDSELTARQLFLITAPAVPQPDATPKKAPAVKVKPVVPPVKKPPADTASTNHQKNSDTSALVVPASYTPLALKYSILQRKGTNYEEVDPETQFRTGDRIRVKVEANATAYLYIVMGGSSGQWSVIFPSKDIDGGNNQVHAGKPCTIPPGNDSFYFDETAGVEKVSLVLSRAPEPDLEKLIYKAGDPSRTGDSQEHKTIMAQNNPIDGTVVGHLRDQMLSRDLVFEKFDGTAADGKPEKAFYAATKDKSDKAQLFVDLKLVHK